jgi:hypothetical protein
MIHEDSEFWEMRIKGNVDHQKAGSLIPRFDERVSRTIYVRPRGRVLPLINRSFPIERASILSFKKSIHYRFNTEQANIAHITTIPGLTIIISIVHLKLLASPP